MSKKPDLRLAWCSYDAAKHAVENWHYSRRMPRSKLVRIGAWEEGRFIGAVIFGTGACPQIAKPFGLKQHEAAELVRVALREHRAPVSRIVSIAIRMLRKHCPKLRLLVSFADPNEGHHGGIYQAMGWTYSGRTAPSAIYFDKRGKEYHGRNVGRRDRYDRHGISIHAASKMARREVRPGKYRYLYPLDNGTREIIAPFSHTYPKRAGSIETDAPSIHGGEGGVNPTPALQTART